MLAERGKSTVGGVTHVVGDVGKGGMTALAGEELCEWMRDGLG